MVDCVFARDYICVCDVQGSVYKGVFESMCKLVCLKEFSQEVMCKLVCTIEIMCVCVCVCVRAWLSV